MTTIRVMYGNRKELVLDWIEYHDDDEDKMVGEIYETHGFMSDFPKEIVKLAEHLFETRYYHRIDGWRGYYDVKPDKDKLEHLGLGFNWLSGHHSATKEEKKMILLKEAIRQLELPVFLVTTQTGNFSAYTDVFVRKEDKDTFNKVSKFIEDFVGDSDPRWDVGVLMHFDSDKTVGQSVIEDLNKQELPEWWNWKTFIEKHHLLEHAVDGMETKPLSSLEDQQQISVLSQGMLSQNPLMVGVSKLLIEMRVAKILTESNNQGS